MNSSRNDDHTQVTRSGETHATLSIGPAADNLGRMIPSGYWSLISHDGGVEPGEDPGIMISWAPLDGSAPVALEFPPDVTFLEVARHLAGTGNASLRQMFELTDPRG